MDFKFFFRRFFDDDHYSTRDSIKTNDQGNVKDDAIFDDSFERFGSPNDMFRQMEDMFNNMFLSSFRIQDFPKFEEMKPVEPNPRSIMLKNSDEDHISCIKEPGGINILLFDSEKAHNFSYSKFSSFKTVHLPDGTVEEHQTIIDSGGKKTTKVRRSIGDVSHEVISKSDKQGLKEKEENFVNLDENELPNFEKTWSNLKNNSAEPQKDVSLLTVPHSSPSYFSFLKRLFGPL